MCAAGAFRGSPASTTRRCVRPGTEPSRLQSGGTTADYHYVVLIHVSQRAGAFRWTQQTLRFPGRVADHSDRE